MPSKVTLQCPSARDARPWDSHFEAGVGGGRLRCSLLSTLIPRSRRMSAYSSGVPGLPFSATQTGSTAPGGGGGGLILWTDSEKVTSFSPSCHEQILRLDTVQKHVVKLVERLRCCSQPNPAFRGDRLVPSDLNAVSERLQFLMALRDSLICFDNLKPLAEYAQELSAIEEDIERLHDTFLRRVILFGVKPLKKFLDETHPGIKKHWAELHKMRDKYDNTRAKLPENETTEMLSKVRVIQGEFMEKANQLAAMLKEMPMHQMAIAKAVDDCARSEADFCAQSMKLIDSVKPPDYKKRWE